MGKGETIHVVCTVGEGPDVVMDFKDKGFILFEEPRHNKPPQGDWTHGFVMKGSCDLTHEEATHLGERLILAATQAREWEKEVDAKLTNLMKR